MHTDELNLCVCIFFIWGQLFPALILRVAEAAAKVAVMFQFRLGED